MADGATQFTNPKDEPRLMAATAARSSLWGRCGCGRTSRLDPTPWLNQGLGRLAIEVFEERLRCVCGARRVALEIRGLAEAPVGATGGIWLFR
jgi:hypothetical protein